MELSPIKRFANWVFLGTALLGGFGLATANGSERPAFVFEGGALKPWVPELSVPKLLAIPFQGSADPTEIEPVRYEFAMARVSRVLWQRHTWPTGEPYYERKVESVCTLLMRQPVYDVRGSNTPYIIRGESAECGTTREGEASLNIKVAEMSILSNWDPFSGEPGSRSVRGYHTYYYAGDGQGRPPAGVEDAHRWASASAYTRQLEASGMILNAESGLRLDPASPPETVTTFSSLVEFMTERPETR